MGWYGAKASKNALDMRVVIRITSEASPANGETAARVASPISDATRTADKSRSKSNGSGSVTEKKTYQNQFIDAELCHCIQDQTRPLNLLNVTFDLENQNQTIRDLRVIIRTIIPSS